ncbi:MAG: hypothetical protein S4CHLAM7_03440 [Chlamydiae bacterium]|nr:hypothetical protein [Chlamydiota bacterium]
MSKINLIHLKGCPIFKQLQLEEALLRADNENYCLINEGSGENAIVMGISSKVSEHLNEELVHKEKISVIKRFSGGGTVYVDSNTLFITFIINKDALAISPFPEPILDWGAEFYQSVFQKDTFSLKENDYVLGDKKIGGNAEYIRKDRWLLHTSFLWDYSEEKMKLLQNPKKAPNYRNRRTHRDFLTKLAPLYPDKRTLVKQAIESLKNEFHIERVFENYPSHLIEKEHRKSTKYMSL